MRFRNLRTLLTCEASALLLLGALNFSAFGGSCDSTTSILSNDMLEGAGNGDTLWVANSGSQSYGLNDTIGGKGWHGYTLGCYSDRALGHIAFGGGIITGILNSTTSQKASALIWFYPDRGKAAYNLHFVDTTGHDLDTVNAVVPLNAVWSNGYFFFACGKGGIVRWHRDSNGTKGWIPGSTVPFVPDQINRNAYPLLGTAQGTVNRVDKYGDSNLVVSTNGRVWLFNTYLNTWDSSITTALNDPVYTLDSIAEAFVNNNVKPPLLYAFMHCRREGKDTISLLRYHKGIAKWSVLMRYAPSGVTPASRGVGKDSVSAALYTISFPNTVKIYRDSIGDSALTELTTPVQDYKDFNSRLKLDSLHIPLPDQINDITFIPTDSIHGHLAVITSSGLFYAGNEVPGSSVPFSFVQRALPVAGGLSVTYALPGILTDYNDPGKPGSKTMFVYKLNRDANVSIKIYDYAMQLTKVVINNEFRHASGTSGRSTDATRDVWDGRTDAGRMAAPGVYYYKITASTGEHSFGKIILAKMQVN